VNSSQPYVSKSAFARRTNAESYQKASSSESWCYSSKTNTTAILSISWGVPLEGKFDKMQWGSLLLKTADVHPLAQQAGHWLIDILQAVVVCG
jgi:hypothetical protein